MKNGVRITRKTARGIDVVFIPEEIIQINQLNRRIRENVDAQERAAADEQARIAELNRQKDEANHREQAHRQQIQKTLRGCITLVAIASAAWLVVPLGLMSPVLAAVVSLPCLGGACYRLGTIR